jgi:RHS repeat-associated protein
VYRYAGKRFNPATDTYDMGFRDYSPGLNRFLTRDTFNGALADLHLTTNPWTMSRYTFAGGNPTTLIEYDGHLATCTPDGENFCPNYDVRDQPSAPPVTAQLPMLPGRTEQPLNDQPGHPEYDSASWWKKLYMGDKMSQQWFLATRFKAYFCTKGEISCAQWEHWLGAAGDDLVIDPAILLGEENFSNDVNSLLNAYRDMAVEECTSTGSATCEYRFSSGWDPTLDTTVQPVSVDVAGMGQVQLSLSGTIAVVAGGDGTATVRGEYRISIYKAWNFDQGEYPAPRFPLVGEVTIPHAFYQLPAYGYAQDFLLRGTSGARPFDGTT